MRGKFRLPKRIHGLDNMSSKDVFIVRTTRTGSSVSTVTLPSGSRVRTLDRGLFDRAVTAAEKVISSTAPGAESANKHPVEPRKGESAA